MYPEDILDKVQEIEKSAIQITQNKNQEKTEEKISLKKKMIDFFKDLSKIEDKSEIRVKNEVIELLQMLDRKYSFDTIFNSEIDFSLQFLYLKAHLFQKIWDLEELSKILEKVEKLFESKYNFKNPEFYINDKNPKKKFFKLLTPKFFQKINYMIIYIETLLQHTAVLSQIDNNKGALLKANKCFFIYKSYFSILNKVFGILTAVGPENISNLDFEDDMFFKKILDFLEFIEFWNFPTYEEIENNWDKKVINWDLVKNNNEKFLIKQIQPKYQNDYKVNFDWVYNFHISNIVKLSNFQSFQDKLKNPIINKKFITKTFLIFSCCIFSIAAENRFISNKEILTESQIEKNQKVKSNNQKYMDEVSKELKLQKNKRFVFSEKIHLKALEIILFVFKEDIKLFKHFLHSYKKNYTFNILAIEEVEEPSVTTLNNSEYFDNPFLQKNNDFREIDKLNEKLSKLMIKKNIKKKKNSKSPLKKKKNFFQQFKVDTRDLSPQFYKNLNPKFLKKNNSVKKNLSISNRKYFSKKKNPEKESSFEIQKQRLKKSRNSKKMSKSRDKLSKRKLSKNKKIKKDQKNKKSKLQELITEINQNTFNNVEISNKELNLKIQNLFQKKL